MSDHAVVRPAVPEDASFLDAHDHVSPSMIAELTEAGRILVLQFQGAPAGWLRWNLFWDEIPFMNMLFVLEPYRSRGFASRLMAEWESGASSLGHDAVMTSSQADETAQHLYRRRGYVDCGALTLPGQAADELVFRKELTAPLSPTAP